MPSKRSVGARELKTRLGKYIRAVRRGTTFIITERGEAVAELRPLPVADDLASRLQDLANAGFVSRASGEPLAEFKPVDVSGPSITRTLLDEREDRF